MDLKVLYEDNHLVAVFKPARMLVHDDVTGDSSLYDQVKYYLKNKYNKPGNVFLGLVHRLDRPVSGVILFARTSKAAARLSEQFRKHEVRKIYYAVVHGHLKERQGTLINYLKKDQKLNLVTAHTENVAGSLYAELSYEVVAEKKNTSLVKVQLKTGRPHQIRAQLSFLGHTILGDIKYGDKDLLPDQNGIALFSAEMEFKHPTKDEKVKIELPYLDFWEKYGR